MVDGIRFVEKGINKVLNKDIVAKSKKETKNLFARSAFYCRNLKKGHVIEQSDIMMKKPGGGLLEKDTLFFTGKKLSKDVIKDDFVDFGDV